jgi:hypothetical protein
MKGKPSAKALPQAPPKVAAAEDISRAIGALYPHDLVRLAAYAQNRVASVGPRAANGRGRNDLLQEAVTRLLEGRRHWYPDNVDIVKYLIRVIESIASEWASHRKRNKSSPEYAALESECAKDDEAGNLVSPFDGIRAESLNLEEQTVVEDTEGERKALADEIEAANVGDGPASMVIRLFQSGMKGPAIQQDLGWTEREYRTTVRRIQRRAQKILERRYGR